LDEDSKLQSIVVNPALSHNEKADVVQLLTQTGGGGVEASKSVKNLLSVMSENGRLGQLDGVVAAFEKLMRAHKGEVDVVVTSAQVYLFKFNDFINSSLWMLVFYNVWSRPFPSPLWFPKIKESEWRIRYLFII
jgi:ATP synthase delta (OSCP) subunit